MLDHVEEQELGVRLRDAIKNALKDDNARTGDLGGKGNTKEYTAAVISYL
jgi:isocitrate dehydrogenase (NAD+)